MSANVYLPQLARIAGIKEEVPGARGIKTFFVDFPDGGGFEHDCGQCAMISVFGKGELMISIASAPSVKEYKQFSIMRVGRVTTAIHDMKEGDIIGVRGPYGNKFPLNDWKGRDLVFIGGGVGLAPIWPVIQTAAANRADFGKITVFYGARTSRDIMYAAELEALRNAADVHLSIDTPEEGWKEVLRLRSRQSQGQAAIPGQCRCHNVRAADHDQVRHQELERNGFFRRSDLHHNRE